MTVVVYRSSDASAPALNGNAGSLITLLDAILVGSGGVAYGAKASSGWTKSFTGTNAGSYRMGGGNQFYLDVNDNNPNGTSLGREAAVRGYEAMTALATGTNPFPTTGQVASPGLGVRKSATNDGTSRTWIALADNKTLILFYQNADFVNRWDGFYFGDFYSLITGDPGRTLLIAKQAFNTNGTMAIDAESNSGDTNGHYMARGVGGAAGAHQFQKYTPFTSGGNPFSSESGPSLDGNYYTSPYMLGDGTDHRFRGRLRGMWRASPGAVDGDTYSGTGDLAGKSFLILGAVGSGPLTVALETSDTWDTSS